jgi:hypothetical protein
MVPLSEKMLDSSPVLRARVGVEVSQEVDSVLDVWACHASKTLDRTEGREIRNRAHELEFRRSGWSHVLGESDRWVHEGLDRVTVRHTIALQHVYHILTLGERNGALRVIPGDLHTQ